MIRRPSMFNQPITKPALMHPFTLTFRDAGLEQAFGRTTLKRKRLQGQIAIVVGVLVYLFAGLLDQWFIPSAYQEQVWNIRLTALCVPAVVLVLTFTQWFARLSDLLLAGVGLAASVGLISMQTYVPMENSAYYYPLMVLATFYTYNFIGTRFVHAFAVDLFVLAAYNLAFGFALDYPWHILFTHDFFIVSANLIGGSAGYIAETNRRMLFVREQELERERELHMTRSLHDGLTGLANRDLLHDRIGRAIAESTRNGSIHCAFFLDMDGFKAINDNYGHKAGDLVLTTLARRLRSAVRSTDTVARIGGDEFFVLALDVGNEQVAKVLADTLIYQFAEPISGVAGDVRLGVSIGMCLFPYKGVTVSDLIHRADQAMYDAKASGKGRYAIAEVPIERRAS